jgi:excisionase family DNA binding protein
LRKTFAPDELAEVLGVSRSTIWREMSTGKLPYTKIGRRRVITEPDLTNYLGEEKAKALLSED